MRAPLEWLKEYVEIEVPTEELCEIMAMHGLCTEEITTAYAEQAGVVVGKLLEIQKHPNADKLKICKVDIGKAVVQIVTGAPNVYEGMIWMERFCPQVRRSYQESSGGNHPAACYAAARSYWSMKRISRTQV